MSSRKSSILQIAYENYEKVAYSAYSENTLFDWNEKTLGNNCSSHNKLLFASMGNTYNIGECNHKNNNIITHVNMYQKMLIITYTGGRAEKKLIILSHE